MDTMNTDGIEQKSPIKGQTVDFNKHVAAMEELVARSEKNERAYQAASSGQPVWDALRAMLHGEK